MKRDDMIRRLDAGEKAIDLSIEKLEDILNDTGIDDAGQNCACCYVDGENQCSICPIKMYDKEQKRLSDFDDVNVDYDDAFSFHFCANLPGETDKEEMKKAIRYVKRVKQWMIEKGEY